MTKQAREEAMILDSKLYSSMLNQSKKLITKYFKNCKIVNSKNSNTFGVSTPELPEMKIIISSLDDVIWVEILIKHVLLNDIYRCHSCKKVICIVGEIINEILTFKQFYPNNFYDEFIKRNNRRRLSKFITRIN